MGRFTHTVRLPKAFPIEFTFHPIGFIHGTGQLAVTQTHYLPTGEPEICVHLVSADGSAISPPHVVQGYAYSEVSPSSFDFRDATVWLLCPVYSARVDRQPRCTLKSAALLDQPARRREIPPPPDDRVIGSGQPVLGFPSPSNAVLLAHKRMWVYKFSDGSFRQLNLPETPHHIRWFEFPGPPKFTSDGNFAAVPVLMFHDPLFHEGQVSRGTKLLIIDLANLKILNTFQPVDKRNIVDFALHRSGTDLMLTANWGNGWQNFRIYTSSWVKHR